MLFRKSKNLVGLDIGSSAIKLVELKDVKGGGYRLVKSGLETLSPEAIVDGAIMDASLVVDTVNRLATALNVRNQDFGTSLSGHSVIVKKISLPSMSPEELGESIRWEAEQYVPFDINDVNLDYVVLDSGAGDTMDVLLVAVKKDKIGDYTSVISQSGRNPLLVDVDAFGHRVDVARRDRERHRAHAAARALHGGRVRAALGEDAELVADLAPLGDGLELVDQRSVGDDRAVHDRQRHATALHGHALVLRHAGDVDGQRRVDADRDVGLGGVSSRTRAA